MAGSSPLAFTAAAFVKRTTSASLRGLTPGLPVSLILQFAAAVAQSWAFAAAVNLVQWAGKPGPSAHAIDRTPSWASAGHASQSGKAFLRTDSLEVSLARTRSSMPWSVIRRSVIASQALWPFLARSCLPLSIVHSARISSRVAATFDVLCTNGRPRAASTGSMRLPTATVTSPLMSRYIQGTRPSNLVVNELKDFLTLSCMIYPRYAGNGV